MKNKHMKLLRESVEDFLNKNLEASEAKLKQYFMLEACEINKKLEEEMVESDFDISDADADEEIEEGFNADPSSDFTSEIKYSLEEDEEDEDVHVDDFTSTDDDEVDVDAEFTDTDTDNGITDGFTEIADKLADLTAIFQELSQNATVDPSIDVEDHNEFDDVDFGEKKVDESFKMKDVPEDAKAKSTEEAGVSKETPLAKSSKSVVDGAKPVKTKNGNVNVVDDKFKNSDAETPKVEDHNNVMDNANGLMTDVPAPANTAVKDKAPLPRKKK